MELGIAGKSAVVCGASKGLGFACAEALAGEKVNLVMNSREFDRIFAAARSIAERYGAEVVPVAADLTHPETPERLVRTALDRFGSLDILIVNAGGPSPGTFADLDDDAWEAAFRLTLMSAVRIVRAALPPMIERKWGRVVILASSAVKQPIPGLILSNSIRSAVVGLAKTLSQEVAAYGITVNTIATGAFGTERLESIFADRAARKGTTVEDIRAAQEKVIPLGRLGRPEEMGWLAAFLASESAAYITGTTIPIDGGLLAGMM